MKFNKLVESMMNTVWVVYDGTGNYETARVYKIFSNKDDAINFVINNILLKKNTALNPYSKMSKDELVSAAHDYIDEFKVE